MIEVTSDALRARRAISESFRLILERRDLSTPFYQDFVLIYCVAFLMFEFTGLLLPKPLALSITLIAVTILGWCLGSLLMGTIIAVGTGKQHGLPVTAGEAAVTPRTKIFAALRTDLGGLIQLGLATLVTIFCFTAPSVVAGYALTTTNGSVAALPLVVVIRDAVVVACIVLGPSVAAYTVLAMHLLMKADTVPRHALGAAHTELCNHYPTYRVLILYLTLIYLVASCSTYLFAQTLAEHAVMTGRQGFYLLVFDVVGIVTTIMTLLQILAFVRLAEQLASTPEVLQKARHAAGNLTILAKRSLPFDFAAYSFTTFFFILLANLLATYIYQESMSGLQHDLTVSDPTIAQQQMHLAMIPPGFTIEKKPNTAFSGPDGIVSEISLVPIDREQRFRIVIQRAAMSSTFAGELALHEAKTRNRAALVGCGEPVTTVTQIGGEDVSLSERSCMTDTTQSENTQGRRSSHHERLAMQLTHAAFYAGSHEYTIWVTGDPAIYRRETVLSVLADLEQHAVVEPSVSFETPTTVADGLTVVATNMRRDLCNAAGLRSLTSSTPTRLSLYNDSAQTVKIAWLNFHGEVVPNAAIAPGKAWFEGTYVSHPWRISNMGGCLTVLTAGTPSASIIIR